MSRSNPHEGATNPAVKWFEWSGEKGVLRYYDKDKKENVEVGLPFTFLLLDQLGSVRGWHEASKSGIYSNEVRDTRQDVLVVKAFKGGTLGEGLYKDIKDRIKSEGGRFNAVCYIAFKDGDELAIGSLRFKGAALGAWMDFSKEHRAHLYAGAIKIDGFDEGKKGRIVFRVPTFDLVSVSDRTNDQAIGLDAALQQFLTGYLKKNKRDQAEEPPHHLSDEEMAEDENEYEPAPVTDDDIPFAWLMPLVLPALTVMGAMLA